MPPSGRRPGCRKGAGVQGHSTRAARALAHLAEVDPALAVLSLWCRHRDGQGETRTLGETITYGPGFDRLSLPEQVGLAAHHVLHVALRHSVRQAALAQRLGPGFDPDLYALAADAIVNETLILAGHAIPRPAVTLTDLLDRAGRPATGPIPALQDWDADRLALALHRDPDGAGRVADWGRSRGFAADLEPDAGQGSPASGETGPQAAEWRNRMLRALEAGRRAGSGIGRLGAFLADLAPAAVPWEVQLRGLLARALAERPRPSWRRPSGRWVARHAEAERSGTPPPAFEPGRQRLDHRPRVAVGLDTSASVDAQTLRLFTAEVQGLTRRSGAETHLLGFDERVFVRARLDPGGGGWPEAGMRRGGGTDYHDLFAVAGRLAPSALVVLTDLDAPLPPAPRFPVIWAIPAPAPAPPYGRLVRIDTWSA